MNYSTFERNTERLTAWFQKKLTHAQSEQIWDAVARLSDSAFTGAVDKMIETRAPNPGKFPTIKDLTDATWAYQAEHITKVYGEDRTDCPVCFGEGVIPYRYFEAGLGRHYSTFTWCGHCLNYQRHIGDNAQNETLLAHGRMTISEVLAKGYAPEFNDLIKAREG